MTDLVVISLEAWDSVWRRNQHLVAGLLRRDDSLRVLFVEPAADPLHELTLGNIPRRGRGLRPGPPLDAVGRGRLWLHQPTKLLPRRVDPRADGRLAKDVLSGSRRLGFSEPVLWVNDPDGAVVLELTGWRALYDVTDDWTRADRTPTETARLLAREEVLLARCREVVVCSPNLQASKRASGRLSLIPNAVDLEAYRLRLARPHDLPAGKVALYAGTVHPDRIDVPLCIETAQRLGGLGRLVVVGPAPLDRADRHALDSAGVVFLGSRPYESVPGYLQHADVLLVPHVVTPFTDSLDPIKLYEYRAADRPVVSTAVAGFRDSGDPRVTVVDRAGFAEVVAAHLLTDPVPDDAEARLPIPTWADRVTQMSKVLARLDSSGD